MAEHRDPPRDALRTALLATTLFVVFGVLRSLSNDDGFLPHWMSLLLALFGGGFLGLTTLRGATTAGPGWLAQRRIKGRSWVRTDQLVRVRAGRRVADISLDLRDGDGRRLYIQWSAVSVSPQLAARVRKDVRVSAAAGADLDALSARILLGGKR